MTDQTPTTEAWQDLIDAHDDAAVYCGFNQAGWDKYRPAIEAQARTEVEQAFADYRDEHNGWCAQARAEVLDVAVLARAMLKTSDYAGQPALGLHWYLYWAEAIVRAILTETER